MSIKKSIISGIFLGAALAITTAFVFRPLIFKKKKVNIHEEVETSRYDEEETVWIRLLHHETEHLVSPAIASVTFYDGKIEKAISAVRERLNKVVELNPWLAGTLVQTPSSTFIAYDRSDTDDASKLLLNIRPQDFIINSEMPIMSVENFYLKSSIRGLTGGEIINTNSSYSLYKVSILQDSLVRDRFAIVSSLCRAVGDARTYYRLHAMISGSTPIAALNPVRCTKFEENKSQCIDDNLAELASKVIRLKSFMVPSDENKEKLWAAFYINDNFVEQVKDKAKRVCDVPFVSTNDIITCEFGKITEAEVVFMPIDLRNHLECLADDMAGNYIDFLPFDQDNYKCPCNIRKSMTDGYPLSKTLSKIPNITKQVSMSIASVTNMSNFAKPVRIPGFDETFHLPLAWTCAPCFCSSMVIFRATGNTLGVLCSLDQEKLLKVREKLGSSSFILKEIESANSIVGRERFYTAPDAEQ